MKTTLYIGLLIFGFTFFGCKSQKLFTERTPSEQKQLIQNNIRSISSKISGNNTTDTTVVLKNFKINYNSSRRSASFYGAAKIIHDSVILVSLRAPLGIEISRVLLQPDKVSVLDRKNNKHLVGDYTYFKNRFNLDLNFNLIHSLLLANFPTGYQLLTQQGDIVRESAAKSDSLFVGNYYTPNRNQYKFSLWLHPKLFKPETFIFYKERNIEDFNIKYSNYTSYSRFYLPGQVSINSGSSHENYSINLDYRSVELTSDTAVHFQVPSKYKTVVIK